MKRIFAPWRSDYTKSTDHTKKENATPEECIFCKKLRDNKDDDHFILKRFKHNVVMLNLYPYNAGHLLVLPHKHDARLQDMSPEAREELMELLTQSTHILQKTMDTHGTNIGINIGKAAGAGIPSHIHAHVLPRWSGDTNFLPTLAQTKQISLDLKELFTLLKPEFDALTF